VTTYLSTVVQDRLAQAQAELDRHLRLRPNGCCAACGEVAPCRRRDELSRVFATYGMLPRRRPGVAGAHFLQRVA
jgi:hypothetical protein